MQNSSIVISLRIAALSIAALGVVFVLNNFLIFWWNWPGLDVFFAHQEWLWVEPLSRPLAGNQRLLGWLQLLLYIGSIALVAFYVLRSDGRTLSFDSAAMSALAAFIIRSAFWAVLLIGVVDSLISFLRIEGFLIQIVDENFAKELGRSAYRGVYVHYPLIAISLVIGFFTRTLGFTWLTLLIVIAELLIVITRFIFSYEQAFMGDLVRFWYAALFLFASAYTLMEEGHVRVDILYTGFTERGKAWSNVFGTALLGLPLCWIILTSGLWGKSSLINAPLLAFEITQSGYGLYVKYLMAGFLLVYALSMMIQFVSFFLNNAAILMNEPDAHTHEEHLTV
jgi:TRAP-type mannitol/chloroaromatic compound transport system permease small subunit